MVRKASINEKNLEFGFKDLEITRVKCAGRAFQAEGTAWAKAQRCDNSSKCSDEREHHDSSGSERSVGDHTVKFLQCHTELLALS